MIYDRLKQVFAAGVIAAMLIPSTAVAADSGEQPARKNTARRGTKADAVSAAMQEELRQIREALQQQQQQIDALKQQVAQRDEQLRQNQQALQTAQSSAQQAQQRAEAAQSAIDAQKTSIEQANTDISSIRGTLTETASSTQADQVRMGKLEDLLGRFRLTGDVRVRWESFLQDGTQDRYRPRIRVRLGVDGKLSEDFTGGLALASGGLNDPTSTNSTLGEGFERKYVSFDRGYITYNPSAHKWLSLTGGKFAFTWQKTNQTFDPDINPEGFSQKISFDLHNPIVKNLSVIGMQLFLNERSSAADSWAYGGQVQSKLQIGRFWTMTPSYTLLKFRNENQLVNGTFTSTAPTPSGSITGSTIPGWPTGATASISNVFAPNGMTNSVCVSGTGATALPSFCSQFLYSDVILANVFKTPWARFPINVLAEYEENLDATTNNKHLYQFEASVGQTKNRKDFQVGYAFTRAEQDAVIASWAESDQRFPTNVLQHRIFGLVKIAPNTNLGYTQWIGRALNTNLTSPAFGFSSTGAARGFSPLTTPGGHEPWLKRGQLDVIYTF